jgi:hypothetical protein
MKLKHLCLTVQSSTWAIQVNASCCHSNPLGALHVAQAAALASEQGSTTIQSFRVAATVAMHMHSTLTAVQLNKTAHICEAVCPVVLISFTAKQLGAGKTAAYEPRTLILVHRAEHASEQTPYRCSTCNTQRVKPGSGTAMTRDIN